MTQFIHVIKNAQTGEVTEVPFTQEEIDAYILASIPTAEQNKQTAIQLLQQTDWTTISDVGDPLKSNPYLMNVDEFVTYRNAVRQYAINPVEGNIDWPTLPTEQWSS